MISLLYAERQLRGFLTQNPPHARFSHLRGSGLGKEEQGATSHIRVSKKEETEGLGFKKDVGDAGWGDQWGAWSAAFEQGGPIGGSAAVRGDSDSDSDSDSSAGSGNAAAPVGRRKRQRADVAGGSSGGPPSFEALFAATGGARLGMRARREQPGKLQRAERRLEEGREVAVPTLTIPDTDSSASESRGRSSKAKKSAAAATADVSSAATTTDASSAASVACESEEVDAAVPRMREKRGAADATVVIAETQPERDPAAPAADAEVERQKKRAEKLARKEERRRARREIAET